jgi:FkbM family methyltransferase
MREGPEDRQPPFGHYPVAPLHRLLLRRIRACGKGRLGRAAASAMRRLFILTHRSVVDAEVDSIRFRFHLGDNVSERRYFFTPEFYDRQEYEFIRRELPPDGVFFDIGANVGLYSLWATSVLDRRGRVVAMEPNPPALRRLRFNIACNHREDLIQVVAMGASDVAGEFELHLDSTNLGGSSLESNRPGTGGSIIVACAPLVDIAASQGISRIDIMKLDIEGHEPPVLEAFFASAPVALRPRAIIVERAKDPKQQELEQLLGVAGYRLLLRTRMNNIYLLPNS